MGMFTTIDSMFQSRFMEITRQGPDGRLERLIPLDRPYYIEENSVSLPTSSWTEKYLSHVLSNANSIQRQYKRQCYSQKVASYLGWDARVCFVSADRFGRARVKSIF